MSGTETMPVLFLGHGAPPLADDRRWPGQLRGWAGSLARPSAILIVSAHWEAAPATMSATSTIPLVYDFWGFPERYYQVQYAAPGAPELARSVSGLLGSPGRRVEPDESRGLDHGAYVPLKEMYPEADIPVLQLSMPSLDPVELMGMGERLAPLRDENVLIVGSGFTTHNLSTFKPHLEPDYAPPAWSAEFDAWAEETMAHRDYDALLDFLHKAPAGRLAHPRTEHFAPLFVALGAAGHSDAQTTVDGFWYGLSKRSWQLN